MKEKLKIIALIAFIAMCVSITIGQLTITTSIPTKADTIYIDGASVKTNIVTVGSAKYVVFRYGDDIEVARYLILSPKKISCPFLSVNPVDSRADPGTISTNTGKGPEAVAVALFGGVTTSRTASGSIT